MGYNRHTRAQTLAGGLKVTGPATFDTATTFSDSVTVSGTFTGPGSAAVGQGTSVSLSTATGNAGILSWQNPTSSTILITDLVIDITTPAGSGTLDAGCATASNASADNLIDGAAQNATATLWNGNDTTAGTNGGVALLTATQYLTITGSADPAALVGTAYITWIPVS